MSTKGFVLALGIGTTSTKAVLFTLNGKVISEVEREITSYYPQLDWVEQDPNQMERLSVEVIQDVLKKSSVAADNILSLGVSSAMHSLICIDRKSTRLNSSHVAISYAVFCLQKK